MIGVTVTQESAFDGVALIRLDRIDSRAYLVRDIKPVHVQQLRKRSQVMSLQSGQSQLDQEEWTRNLEPLDVSSTGFADSVNHPGSSFVHGVIVEVFRELEAAGHEHLGQVDDDGSVSLVFVLGYEPLAMDRSWKLRRKVRGADESHPLGEDASASRI